MEELFVNILYKNKNLINYQKERIQFYTNTQNNLYDFQCFLFNYKVPICSLCKEYGIIISDILFLEDRKIKFVFKNSFNNSFLIKLLNLIDISIRTVFYSYSSNYLIIPI